MRVEDDSAAPITKCFSLVFLDLRINIVRISLAEGIIVIIISTVSEELPLLRSLLVPVPSNKTHLTQVCEWREAPS